MQPNEKGTQKDLVLYRIETSKSDIKAAEILLAAKEFRGANNRAYYGIYHAISAVHALDGNAYKRIRIFKISFLPGNRFLEKAYAAGIPVPSEITSVVPASIMLFLNQSRIGFSVNTAL